MNFTLNVLFPTIMLRCVSWVSVVVDARFAKELTFMYVQVVFFYPLIHLPVIYSAVFFFL